MTVQDEIRALEERLRQAELGPDPAFFEEVLADEAVVLDESGDPSFAKPKIVEAHRPGKGPKFTRVEMSDLQIVAHEGAAVVTCTGRFEAGGGGAGLKFLRVWLKKAGRWKIVAATVSPAET